MGESQHTHKSRTERYAKELEDICRLIEKGPNESTVENETDPIPRLLTLCNFIKGTDVLKEYVRELLMTGVTTGFPQRLLVNSKKGAFGLFNQPLTEQFERMQILVNQPIAMKIALRLGEKKRARQLYRRIQLWRKEFEKKYGEKVEYGIDMCELERQLKYLNVLHQDRE